MNAFVEIIGWSISLLTLGVYSISRVTLTVILVVNHQTDPRNSLRERES